MPTGDTTWRDALLLAAPRIAGLKVRPLSAWHCHVAQMIGVRLGFDDQGQGPTPGDIAHAVAICRSAYRPDVSGVPIAGWFLRHIYLPLRWLFWPWQTDAWNLAKYVMAYRRYPEVVRKKESQSTPMGCPPYFAVAVDVTMMLPSISLTDALNMPLLSLYCIRAAAVELDGGPSCAWRNESDEDIQKAIERAQRAIARYNEQKKQEVPNGAAPR